MSDSSNVGQMPAAEAQPTVPQLIPWRYVIVVAAGLVVAALLGQFTAGEAGVLAGVAGFMVGVFSLVSRGYLNAVIVGAAVTAAGAASLGFDSTTTTILASILLVALASWESIHTGSRGFVMGLLAYIILTIGVDSGGDWTMVIAFIAGTAVGVGTFAYLGLIGLIPAQPISLAAGVALGAFLAVGLAACLLAIQLLDHPRSYLVALIFVGRGLSPFEGFRDSALRYGLGALIGAVIAFLILLLELPMLVNVALALVAAAAGIRRLAQPNPIAPGLLTMSILLALNDSQEDILIRMLSVTIAVGLAFVLSFGIGWLWRLLNRRFPIEVYQHQPTAD